MENNYIILFVMIFICGVLTGLFIGRQIYFEKTQKNSFDYYQYKKKEAEMLDRHRQRFEDDKMDRSIQIEAINMLNAYIKGEIVLRNPLREAYIVYDHNTAKYLDKNIHELIKEEYNKQKENYIILHGRNI